MKSIEARQSKSSARDWTRFPTIGIAVIGLVLAGCATHPKMPQLLQVPVGQKLVLHAYAKGVQVYVSCSDPANPAQLAWKLKGPEAMLFSECGNVIGSHYAGPTWQSDRDGSKVKCEVVAQSQSPSSNAIPWLLLRARSEEGSGFFQKVSYVQRLNTERGLARTVPPGAPNQEARIPYTGEYLFYRARL